MSPITAGFLVEGIDDLAGVVGDLHQRLLGEGVRVRASFLVVHPLRATPGPNPGTNDD